VATYHGKAGLVYLSTTGTGAAVNVGNLSAWSLSLKTDRVEDTAFGATNKTYKQGLADRSGNISGFFDDTNVANLITSSDSTDGIKMYIYPASTAATKYFYGPAWLDLSFDSSVTGMVTFSGSFQANGAWGAK